VYTNSSWRLNYVVGGEVTTMYHLDRPMYLLGYLAAQSRVYLIDKEYSIVSYTLLLSMIEFKTLIMRGDVDAAMVRPPYRCVPVTGCPCQPPSLSPVAVCQTLRSSANPCQLNADKLLTPIGAVDRDPYKLQLGAAAVSLWLSC
jgi:hypothetical protein